MFPKVFVFQKKVGVSAGHPRRWHTTPATLFNLGLFLLKTQTGVTITGRRTNSSATNLHSEVRRIGKGFKTVKDPESIRGLKTVICTKTIRGIKTNKDSGKDTRMSRGIRMNTPEIQCLLKIYAKSIILWWKWWDVDNCFPTQWTPLVTCLISGKPIRLY